MPRKNARPAAKKAAARRKAQMASGKKPDRRRLTVGHFGHYQLGYTGVVMAALSAFSKGNYRD